MRTYHDGARILLTIARLFKNERPLVFFSLCAALCALVAVVLAWPVLLTYLHTGLVPRLPTAVLSASLVLLGAVLLACGLILDTVTRGRIELKHLAYLSMPRSRPPSSP